jgi:hypothetical protein
MNPEVQFWHMNELMGEQMRQLVTLQGTDMQLPFTRVYGYTQLVQRREEEQNRQLDMVELQLTQVPLLSR